MKGTTIDKEKLLQITFHRLSEKYPSGLYDWLYQNYPELYREINELEDRINENFLNNGSIQELKASLRSYWTVHIKAVRGFKESGQIDISLDKIRTERINELETVHRP